MDLTAGYHQAPLYPPHRVFNAFLCICGLYQFTRLPFGPKWAPSYFQEQMVTKVLQGLLYVSCEMYLDDCIVYASSEDQFLVRLKEVSQRFRERGPLLKAKKCKFGLLCRSRHLSRGSVNIKGQDPVGTQTAEPPRTEIPIGTGELLPGICTKSLVNCKTASRYD